MTQQQTPRPDVIVIGAGVMGLSVSLQLARRGRRVMCLDRSSPGREASAATAGTLAVQNKPLASIPLTLRALAMWREMERELGFDVEYEARGGLRIAQTAEDVEKLLTSADGQRRAGAPVEIVEPPRLFDLAPYLAPDIALASYCTLDGMCNPFATVRALFRACRTLGVDFRLHEAVDAVCPLPDGTVRVQGPRSAIEGGALVIATGAWMAPLAKTAGVDLPIVPRVQQVLITDFGPPLFSHIVTHVRGNLTLKQQAGTGKVLVGGGWQGTVDEGTGARRLSRESIVGNARAAVGAIPSLARTRLLRAWTGFEGRSPDKLPLIGPMPGVPNVYFLGCASGGLTQAPAAGLLLAQWMVGEPPDLPMEAFSPARFGDRAG